MQRVYSALPVVVGPLWSPLKPCIVLTGGDDSSRFPPQISAASLNRKLRDCLLDNVGVLGPQQPAAYMKWDTDDLGYVQWLTTHPKGFQANTRRPVGGRYFRIHRADCQLPDRSKP